jgi:tetratricopeptide (TPR) repeat protein
MTIGDNKDLYLRALNGRAKVLQFTGQYQRSIEDFRGIKKNTRDPLYLFEYYRGISSVHERRGQFRKAIAFIEKALRLSRRCRGSLNEALLRNIKIYLMIQKGDNARALKYGYSILRQDRRTRNDSSSRTVYQDREKAGLFIRIGNAYQALEKFKKALHFFLQARKMHLRANYPEGVSVADNNLTLAYWKIGNYKKALQHGREALAVREKIGHVHGISSTLNNLGLINDEMGNYREALYFYEKALANFIRLNDIYGMTIALTNIGSIHHEILGDLDTAFDHYLKCLNLVRKTGDLYGEIEGLLAMAEMYWRRKDLRAFFKTIMTLNQLIPRIKSGELKTNFLLLQIKLQAWRKNNSLRDKNAGELIKTLKRSKNDLLIFEGIAAFIDIVYMFNLDDWLDDISPQVREMARQLRKIESPLKRTKILRALVKYHLLAKDRAQAAKYFRAWEASSTRYGIKAEAEEIAILRSKIKV